VLILPTPYQTKVFIPVPQSDWREPSQAQPKDQLGNQNRRRYYVSAIEGDRALWRGCFVSRDDADAFYFAILQWQINGTQVPRSIWDLPTPHWHPEIAPFAWYAASGRDYLTTSGSLATWTSPLDWNNSFNTIETIAAGGGGAGGVSLTNKHCTGGGGGAWNKILNFSVATPGTTTASYRCGAGGGGGNATGPAGSAAGSAGADTWFNGTAVVGSSVGSKGGQGGAVGSGNKSGGAGGVGASGVGTSNNNGGRGGNLTGASGTGGSGGGGGAGASAAGSHGVDSSSTGTPQTAGGQGDGTAGGAGGGGGGSAGSPGTEWDSTHGSGGGGGGSNGGSAGTLTGGAGGNYGAAGAGAENTNTAGNANGGAGTKGLIILTYVPLSNMWNTPQPPENVRRVVNAIPYDARAA